MSAVRPEPAVLEGRFIRLEPMTAEHLPRAVGGARASRGLRGRLRRRAGGPAARRGELPHLGRGVLRRRQPQQPRRPHHRRPARRRDRRRIDAGRLRRREARARHIGWTGYDPRVWGTQVNAEAKLLMLGLAFDNGFETGQAAGGLPQRPVAGRDREARRAVRRGAAQGAAARRRHAERDRRVLDPRRRVAGRAGRTRGAARVVRRPPGAVPQRGRADGGLTLALTRSRPPARAHRLARVSDPRMGDAGVAGFLT